MTWQLALPFTSIPFTALSGLLCWMTVVRILRWRRYSSVHSKYKNRWTKDEDGKLKFDISPQEAQDIMKLSWAYDMPTLLNYALAFALFKTYAIPSISRLLCATRELRSEETIAKRYADTEIIWTTMMACPISGFIDPSVSSADKAKATPRSAEDPRAMIALARMNYLHSHYKISNDDFLYTLALAILEGSIWAKRYGWRELSPLEKHAQYVFWAEIGRNMGIKDIPESFDDLYTWAREYEETYMVPAQSNHDLAGYTVAELLSAVPNVLGLRSFGEKAVICLMDDIVREAMMYPKQPRFLTVTLTLLIRAVHYFERWFMLPRWTPLISVSTDLSIPRGNNGCPMPRLYPSKWTSRPWYRPEPTNFIGRWRERLLVAIGYYKETPGVHLKSGGYRLEELGPLKFEKEGHDDVMREASKLLGCPVSGPWSLEGRSGR